MGALFSVSLVLSQTLASLHCKATDAGLVHRAVCMFAPQLSLVLIAPTQGGFCQAELTWVAGYTPRWFTRQQTVTYLGTNRAGPSATTFIETSALLLSQIVTCVYLKKQKKRFWRRLVVWTTHHASGCGYFSRCLYFCPAESAKSRQHDNRCFRWRCRHETWQAGV